VGVHRYGEMNIIEREVFSNRAIHVQQLIFHKMQFQRARLTRASGVYSPGSWTNCHITRSDACDPKRDHQP
jgi:hypothetical protein